MGAGGAQWQHQCYSNTVRVRPQLVFGSSVNCDSLCCSTWFWETPSMSWTFSTVRAPAWSTEPAQHSEPVLTPARWHVVGGLPLRHLESKMFLALHASTRSLCEQVDSSCDPLRNEPTRAQQYLAVHGDFVESLVPEDPSSGPCVGDSSRRCGG